VGRLISCRSCHPYGVQMQLCRCLFIMPQLTPCRTIEPPYLDLRCELLDVT
jgi:hypothetical protein